ncbi:hypothetical protein [Corynebacterium cystitidis]|uniref:hypothetical protein n=1 Tax=Corynebacterium cystitidis TaxID=35757 RepID=UPI000B80A735|nr:hypothetical protein [Corynebacterium cystitidis]
MLETAVSAVEISLEDYGGFSGLIASHLPEAHKTADASTDQSIDALIDVPVRPLTPSPDN